MSFARFISVEFEVWCDNLIYDVISGNKEVIDIQQAQLSKLKVEEELLKEKIIDTRIGRVKLLQSMGINFDPVILIDTGKIKGKLDEDTSKLLSDTYSDIRTGIRVFSNTHLLNKNEIKIRTKDFNDAMIQAGLMDTYMHKGSKYRKFVNKVNYYGYNRDSSSIKELPYMVVYYEDRFMDLVQLLKNDGYLD